MEISFRSLTSCSLCPHNCNARRFSDADGYCRIDYNYNISSIVSHHGEEPVISGRKGICNIFFNHCNLQCVYCQNHQISANNSKLKSKYDDLEQVISDIEQCLRRGCKAIGFVSPSHQLPQMLSIIRAFENYHSRPVFVYNTNTYDKAEALKELEGIIDVFLPDMKYVDGNLSKIYSGAHCYPEIAKKALQEMLRQKGSALHLDDDGLAISGIIIRHMVLPGHVENSLGVLRFIAEELSPKLHISLMSQYYPTMNTKKISPLNRTLRKNEYDRVVNEMERLGLSNGWIQELDSNDFYRPDFGKKHPFEG